MVIGPSHMNVMSQSVSVGSLEVSSWISSISVELTGRFDVMRLTVTIGS